MNSSQHMDNQSKLIAVYIIDGDVSSRRGLSNLLSTAGFKVEAFTSVEEFLLIETIHSRSCLIVDAWVNDLPSEGLQSAIIQKFHNIPIIFLSASDDRTTMEKAMRENAAGFFRKPVDGPALIDAISWGIQKENNSKGH